MRAGDVDWLSGTLSAARDDPELAVTASRALRRLSTEQKVARTSGYPLAFGREAVRKLKEMGADFVKVYSSLTPEVYRAIVDEAKKHKLTVAGHCPEQVSAAEASDAGHPPAAGDGPAADAFRAIAERLLAELEKLPT